MCSGGSRKFWWGGFEAKTSKIRMSSPKLRLIFRPKSEIQTFLISYRIAQNLVVSKKKKRSSPKLRLIFRPKPEIQTFFSPKIRWSPKKKKKKRSSLKLRLIFRPDSLRLGRWGGDASRNGAELFKIRADFSAKIVTFRLVGGCIPPIPPPKSATGCVSNNTSNFRFSLVA